MKNILGHDDASEIITIIARLRENKFSIVKRLDDEILFEIVLVHYITVPVPTTIKKIIRFAINRVPFDKSYKYFLKQIKGIEIREIPFVDGYIIWGLLEERKS